MGGCVYSAINPERSEDFGSANNKPKYLNYSTWHKADTGWLVNTAEDQISDIISRR